MATNTAASSVRASGAEPSGAMSYVSYKSVVSVVASGRVGRRSRCDSGAVQNTGLVALGSKFEFYLSRLLEDLKVKGLCVFIGKCAMMCNKVRIVLKYMSLSIQFGNRTWKLLRLRASHNS